MNALLWLEETSEAKFNVFEYFKLALFNLFDNNLKIISDLEHIHEINNLIILDEHFESHKNAILNNGVVEKLNKKKCNVIIFNFEKIYKSHFKYNLDTQKKIKKIENLTQILSDIEDIKKIGSPFLNKQLISKEFKINFDLPRKKNEILFIGQIKGKAYKNRRIVLENLSQVSNLPITFKFPNRKLNYDDFIFELSKYQYIFNPLGSGDFINVRYYESLLVNSVPIQQYKKNMKKYFSEINESFSINFEVVNYDLNNQIKEFKPKKHNYYLEDYLYAVNFSSYLRN